MYLIMLFIANVSCDNSKTQFSNVRIINDISVLGYNLQESIKKKNVNEFVNIFNKNIINKLENNEIKEIILNTAYMAAYYCEKDILTFLINNSNVKELLFSTQKDLLATNKLLLSAIIGRKDRETIAYLHEIIKKNKIPGQEIIDIRVYTILGQLNEFNKILNESKQKNENIVKKFYLIEDSSNDYINKNSEFYEILQNVFIQDLVITDELLSKEDKLNILNSLEIYDLFDSKTLYYAIKINDKDIFEYLYERLPFTSLTNSVTIKNIYPFKAYSNGQNSLYTDNINIVTRPLDLLFESIEHKDMIRYFINKNSIESSNKIDNEKILELILNSEIKKLVSNYISESEEKILIDNINKIAKKNFSLEDFNNKDKLKELVNIEKRIYIGRKEKKISLPIYLVNNSKNRELNYLLSKGLDVNTQYSNDRWTLLMTASLNGLDEIVEMLFDYDIDINIQNRWGETALMLATEYGYFNIVKYLIEKGASLDIVNEKNVTASEIAKSKEAYEGYEEIINLYKEIEKRQGLDNEVEELVEMPAYNSPSKKYKIYKTNSEIQNNNYLRKPLFENDVNEMKEIKKSKKEKKIRVTEV
jgi:ankyrin repeat protein